MIHVYAVFPVIMAVLCASVGVFELLTWVRMKGGLFSSAFAIICLAAAAYNLACAGEYNVVTPAASVIWLRIQSITLELTTISFFWYVAGRTGFVPRWAIPVALAVFGICASFQVLPLGNLTWNVSRPMISHVRLPWGAEVVYVEVDPGPLTDAVYLLGVLFFAYMVWVIIRYSRAGNKKEAASLLLMSGIVFVAIMNDLAISQDLYSSLYSLEYAWLAVVIFVGMQRSSQLIEAAATRHALVESERRYRAIFESLQDVYFRADSKGILRLISPSVRSFGYEATSLIGRPVSSFSSDEQAAHAISAALSRKDVISDFEMSVAGANATTIHASVNAHRLFDDQGHTVGIEGIIRDITDRKRAEQRVLASLQEKSILLKEIHHRVKNNLQIISSLLYLQEIRVHDPIDKRILQDCRNQVLSMALIHEDLYGSGDFRSVDFGAYVSKLVNRLIVAFRMSDVVAFLPAVENISLAIDKAIPCGLVANELCTNALKYAFPPGSRTHPCELRVELARIEGQRVSLAVGDNGVGLPLDFELSRASTLGLQIVEKLVKQVGGVLRLEREHGTRWVIEFAAG